jgi:hypothetical protein
MTKCYTYLISVFSFSLVDLFIYPISCCLFGFFIIYINIKLKANGNKQLKDP